MRRLLALTALLLACHHAVAYELTGNSWPEGSATFLVGIEGNAPSGESWNTAFKRAMGTWSSLTTFDFIAVDQYQDPCLSQGDGEFGDTITGVDFVADRCGTGFGDNVLAVTLASGFCRNPECTGGFDINDADIVFNSNETWDIYSGPRSNIADFERVALHELGHALGLGHESAASAIMQPLVSDLDTLTSDDINGANAIYGGTTTVVGTVATVYGLDVLLPAQSELNGPSDSVVIDGTLDGSDGVLNDRRLDVYQFTIGNDSLATVQLQSSDLNTFLYFIRVTSAQDTIDAYTFSDDNGGIDNNSLISANVQAGTYWVGVTSSRLNETGDYRLSLNTSTVSELNSFQSYQSIYGAHIEVNPNPGISGTLGTGDFALDGSFVDIYEFDVVNETTLRIDMSSAAIDSKLILVRVLADQSLDEGQLFENDDFAAGSRDSRIERRLPPGTYWIGATSFDAGESGDYEIAVSVVLP